MSAHGRDREGQVRDIAARLGVADFVYSAPSIRKGNAQREASGDGLLVVGERGAILQVKSRDPSKAQLDTAERASAWVRKNAKTALSQGLGTKRELARRRLEGEPLTVFPARAASLEVGIKDRYKHVVTQDTSSWPIIVIVDHPRCPELDLGHQPGVVWLTFNDWRELQRRLRSIAALLRYSERIFSDSHHVLLGREVERYGAMREADEQSVLGSETAHPYLASLDEFDAIGTDVFHHIIDEVWPHDGDIPWQSAAEYRSIVEFLDAVPPPLQSVIGRWVLRKREELDAGRWASSGLTEINFKDRLVYSCSDRKHWETTERWRIDLMGLTAVRHAHAIETGAPDNTVTLGVGALVEERAGRQGISYSFIMLQGRAALRASRVPFQFRRFIEKRYGVYDFGARTMREATFSRNGPCPCMSGKKYKRCCGG